MKLFIFVALIGIMAWLFSQLLKMLINFYVYGRKYGLKALVSDGDYPSSHTSFITSITTFSWLYMLEKYFTQKECIDEMWIAIVLSVFMVIVIRDALGVRYTVQKLCESVTKMAEDMKCSVNRIAMEDICNRLNIKSGHRPHEVVGGIFNGAFISIFMAAIYYSFKIAIPLVITLYVFYVLISIKVVLSYKDN